VLLASYPKSGNTWARALLTGWKTGKAPDLAALDGRAILIDRHLFEEETGIDSDVLTPFESLEWRARYHESLSQRLQQETVVKTHDLYFRAASGRRLYSPAAVSRVVYLVRCPLDVSVSFAHHERQSVEMIIERMACEGTWLHRPPGGIRETLPQLLGSWSNHVCSWVDQTEIPCLVVRYEDMLSDTLGEVRRILSFMGYDWDRARAARAVKHARFEALQQAERSYGFNERPASCPAFFRKGKVGDGRQSLSPTLVERLHRDHCQVMGRFGYR
jgi:aryl sulfotransferase